MNSSKNKTGILCRQIIPAFAALSMFASSAQADSAGVTLINSKLATIPGLKLGTNVLTAKSTDLIYALTLALDSLPSTATATEIGNVVEAALETVGGKARKDKDKIAGQIIATAIANNNITDAAVIAQITKDVVYVNSGGGKTELTATGKASALAGALKAANPAASEAIGAALGGVEFTGAAADVATFLANTSKALSTSAPKAAPSLEAFTKGFLTDEFTTDADRKTQAEAAAALVASKTPAAAGGILGGYVATLTAPGDAALATLAGAYVGNSKLAKALGDILAYTMDGHSDQSALFTTLSATAKDKALVAQGLLRAGSVGEATDTMAAFIATSPDRVKTAGVVAAGNGNSEPKLTTIVTALANGQDATKAKPAIGAAVISSIGILNPESADTAIKALIATGGFADATSRNTLGATIAPKVKAYSAVGYMAAGIAELNIGATTGATAQGLAVTTVNAIMSKASKAATDVVYRTAELSAIASKPEFAAAVATANSKFALNAAVGASLASQLDSGAITAAVIRTAAKTTLAKAPLIAGAVAAAVDEERAAEVLFSVGGLVSETGTVSGKPLKASAFKTLAKSLATAIQKKPNVTTSNRADELGEIAALLTDAVISAYGTLADTDIKKIAARNKAIVAVGTEVLKALSKKPVEESKTLLADKSSSADIAGSVALTIRNAAGLSGTQETALLAAGGALEKALAKLAGKTGSAEFTGVTGALSDVRSGAAAALAGYEDGTLRTGAALSVDFNDKETDKRNR